MIKAVHTCTFKGLKKSADAMFGSRTIGDGGKPTWTFAEATTSSYGYTTMPYMCVKIRRYNEMHRDIEA